MLKSCGRTLLLMTASTHHVLLVLDLESNLGLPVALPHAEEHLIGFAVLADHAHSCMCTLCTCDMQGVSMRAVLQAGARADDNHLQSLLHAVIC
jgi:hypothetical protein